MDEIQGLVESLTSFSKLVGEFLKLPLGRDSEIKAREMGAQVVAAQAAASAAIANQHALLDRKRELEEELVKLRDWENEKSKYRLEDIGGRAFVYAYQPPAKGPGDVHHWLCPTCYEDARKSILQLKGKESSLPGTNWRDISVWYCPKCKTEIRTNHKEEPRQAGQRPPNEP